MSLLLAAAVAAQVVPAAQIDLAAREVYVSPAGREAIAADNEASLICVPLPERSRKFRTACLTQDEWRKAQRLAATTPRNIRLPEELNGLPQAPLPVQHVPSYTAPDPR